MKRDGENKKRSMEALLGAFPSARSFLEFERDDRPISEQAIPCIIQYAFEEGIIEKKHRKAFLQFLTRHGKTDEDLPPEGVSFNDVIDTITKQHSVNTLIWWLEAITEKFSMPKVQASMITRLKKDFNPNTTKKRSVLRILAFWLGKTHPWLDWNYERLRQLPRCIVQDTSPVNEQEGVVIAFNLQGRGDIVEPKAVQWVKDELPKCIEDLKLSDHITRRNIEVSSVASVTLKLPKKRGSTGEPRLYSQAIRESLALAHQMSVRWLLSEHSSQQRILVIAIYAGAFSDASLFLQHLLKVQLPGDPTILLTDFAYLCTEVADVKMMFERHAEQSEIGSGHPIRVWSLSYVWSCGNYEFIPELLEERMLPTTEHAYQKFYQELYFPNEVPQKTFGALSAMDQFPQNALLLIEIAKVLLTRRMYHEADEILANILLVHRCHVAARTLRMMLYSYIALEESDCSVSELAFNRAVAEGKFITTSCVMDEEVWCEFGLVYYRRALKYLRLLRAGKKESLKNVKKKEVFSYLKKAEKTFLKGITISPTGKHSRSFFLLGYTQGLLELLAADDSLFSQVKRPRFEGTQNIFTHVGIRFFSFAGWIKTDVVGETEGESFRQFTDSEARNITKILLYLMSVYENSVLSRNNFPSIKYSLCCLFWDFCPVLTVGLCKQLLLWLEEAHTEAENFIRKNIAIYSLAEYLGPFQSPKEFMKCIDITVETIRNIIPEAILQQNDETLLDDRTLQEVSKVKLMFLHIDRKIETGMLVK